MSANCIELYDSEMPTTRSASKKQTKIDDVETTVEGPGAIQSKQSSKKPKSSTKANTAVKRKASPQGNPSTPVKKKVKSNVHEDENENEHGRKQKQNEAPIDDEKPIMINRSPVLQLWGAVVAQFVHPTESWELCLSIGGSIATLCAVSKGRAIGKIAPSSESADKGRGAKTGKEARSLDVMGFPMQVRNNVVHVDGKPKPLKESNLQGKYGGDENYQRVKRTMEQAIKDWANDKEDLEQKAFHFYEEFRPGSGGWGQQGQLDLSKVKKTITRN